eukprot:TRINITY_DN4349_c1_g2_i2.p1 TRINITY_DN4349_c1_g2~~TRINITY_DN4349_c1_g2_i2.p1  ORF type:complete len:1007 (+),score=300.09 TRINITY_DN4349_c1_g2_i2:83-3022(+)
MAQLDPQMLAALMPAESAFGDETFKHHFDKMSEEERMKEALNRNALDNQMLGLYHECFTDRHLDLAALLMEQHTESMKDPTNEDLKFTESALKLVPWAKAVVTMQLIHIAGQSTTDLEEKGKIGVIQANGQEVIALNYQRCKPEIESMLSALSEAGGPQDTGAASPSNTDAIKQMNAEVRQNEQRMKTILEQLEAGVEDTKAMGLAVEYAAMKAATAAMVNDIQLQDPQKMMHDDWMIDNFTKPLQKAASEVLKSSAYPELKVWANAMDSLTAFTQQGTVEMLNSLLINVSNAYKANQQNIKSKLSRRTSRVVQAATQFNRAGYFLHAVCALDEADWADANVALTSEARNLAGKLEPGDEVLQDWASNVSLLEQYAKEVEKNIDVVIEEREKHNSVITSLLHSSNTVYEQFMNAFDSSHLRIAEHVESGTILDKWATAVKEISIPPDYKVFDTISLYNKHNKGAISKTPKASTSFNSGLLYLKNMLILPVSEWKAVVRTSRCDITDSIPASQVEWAFAATELREYLKKTEERMKIISQEYKKHKFEIDSSNLPSPDEVPYTPPKAPAEKPLEELAAAPLPDTVQQMERKPSLTVAPASSAPPLSESVPVSPNPEEGKKELEKAAEPAPEVTPALAEPAPKETSTPAPETTSVPAEPASETAPAPETTTPAPEGAPQSTPALETTTTPAPEATSQPTPAPGATPESKEEPAAVKPQDVAPAAPPKEMKEMNTESETPAQPQTAAEAAERPPEKQVVDTSPAPPEAPQAADAKRSDVTPEAPPAPALGSEEAAKPTAEGQKAEAAGVKPIEAPGPVVDTGEAVDGSSEPKTPSPRKKKKKKSVTSVGEGGEEGVEQKKKKKKKRKSVGSEGELSPSRKSSVANDEPDEEEIAEEKPVASAKKPQAPEEEKPKAPRVIEIKPCMPQPVSMPLDLLADSESEDEKEKDVKKVFVQPKAQSLSQAVRKNPQIARGIIFIQPREH